MEINYRRALRHNYLVILPEDQRYFRYESKMLAGNTIKGLLKFHVNQSDGKSFYFYDITSKQPLNRLLESRSITLSELRMLIFGIAEILEQIERYLLPEEQLLLDPEYIYIEPEAFQIHLCLVPGYSRRLSAAIGQLLHRLLGYVDHQDKECVILAYGLYQESQKDNFGIGDLLRVLQGNHNHYEEQVVVPACSSEKIEVEAEKTKDWKERLEFFVNRVSKITRTESNQVHESSYAGEHWEEWRELLKEPEPYEVLQKPENEPTTALLADFEKKPGDYCLRPFDGGLEPIFLTSFPFVIGKSGNLADYLLEKVTVSRLHVKIEQGEGGFWLTDLNSTNGTRVQGRLLENNERVRLSPGDEVQIAEWKFRFEVVN